MARLPIIGGDLDGWGTVLNEWLAKGGLAFNVKDGYDAVGDGVADDTAEIQAAIDAATTNGGIVLVPPGVYRCNVVMKPKVKLVGYGMGSTGPAILKAVAGSNADVIKGLNFATLTGKTYASGDYALGAYEAEIRDLVIDGDKATQTAGYGLRTWGRATRLYNVEIKNCKEAGLWTEFTDVDDFGDPNQVLEGFFQNLVVHDCDTHGWVHRGPHDTVVFGATCYSNGSWGFRSESAANSYNSTITMYALNTFLNANGWYVGGNGFLAYGGQAANNNTGTCIEFASGQGSGVLMGTQIAGCADGGNAFILRGTEHRIDVQLINNPGNALKLDGVGWSDIRLTGGNNEVGILVTSETGPNKVRGILEINAASTAPFDVNQTLDSGSWLSATQLDLHASGSAPASPTIRTQFPSATLRAAGWSPKLPASDAILVPSEYGSVASAGTIAVPGEARVALVTGTTNITSVTAKPAGYRVTLIFAGVLTFTAGSNLKLAGGANFVTTSNDTITLVCDGTNWFEVSRAVNAA